MIKITTNSIEIKSMIEDLNDNYPEFIEDYKYLLEVVDEIASVSFVPEGCYTINDEVVTVGGKEWTEVDAYPLVIQGGLYLFESRL